MKQACMYVMCGIERNVSSVLNKRVMAAANVAFVWREKWRKVIVSQRKRDMLCERRKRMVMTYGVVMTN